MKAAMLTDLTRIRSRSPLSHRMRDRFCGAVLLIRGRQNAPPGGFYRKICGAAGAFVHFRVIILHIILTSTNLAQFGLKIMVSLLLALNVMVRCTRQTR